MKLSELLADIEVEKIIGAEQLNVTGIAFNSMEVRPGNIFVCITGFKTDGHKYAADAIDRGAIAVIAERDISELGVTCVICKNTRLALAKAAANFYGHPERKFRLIGITGTNGKTTATYQVGSRIARQKGRAYRNEPKYDRSRGYSVKAHNARFARTYAALFANGGKRCGICGNGGFVSLSCA